MRYQLAILAGGILSLGCGAEYEWRTLPAVDGTQGWLLAPGGQAPQWFDTDGVSVPRFERGRLWALPVSPESLATSAPPELGTGNQLAVLANFTFEEEGWRAENPDPVRVPLVPAVCGDQCVLFEPCPTCASGLGAQTCGPCEPDAPEAPSLPSKDCPPGWTGTDYSDGHFECAPPDVPGLRVACPEQQRWSWPGESCVPIAPCTPPGIAPGDNAIYIDASVGPGGDGSPGDPLQRIPARPGADQTIVLAPGTYSGSIELSEPGVRLLGHGLCSVLTGTSGVDVLRVIGVQAQVGYLWIDAEGPGRPLVVSDQGQLELHDSLLTGDDRVLDCEGSAQVQRSRFIRAGDCGDELCRQQTAAVRLRGGGVVEDVDIEGPTALWGQLTGLTVRQSRLMPTANGYGFFASGPGSFSVEKTTSFGGRVGMFFRADGEMQVSLTDVQIATRTTTTGPGRSVGVELEGQDLLLTQIDLLRTSIESSFFGIDMNYGTVNASQLRLHSRSRGIEAVENERIHIVSVADSWLQTGEEAITVSGSDAFVGNSWARACLECLTPDSRRAHSVFFGQTRSEDVTPDTLDMRVAHVLAADRHVARSFSAMEIYDLTAISTRPDMLDSPMIDGARWAVRGPFSVVEIRERLNVADLAVVTEEPGAATCIQANSDVIIERFSITGPEGMVPLGKDPIVPGTTEQVERWRLSQGVLPKGQLIAASEDGCRTLTSWETRPVLDGVLFR